MTWSTYPTNRFYAHSMRLNLLIGIAFGADSKDITGEPNWLDLQQYDVDAKVEGDQQLTYKEMQPLLQNLLAQRFHLVVHHSTKMTSGYTLLVGKGGVKLQTGTDGVQPRVEGSSQWISSVASGCQRPGRGLVDPCRRPDCR